MSELGLVEHGQQTFYGSLRVTGSRLNVFPQDAPSVLNGAQERVLVGIIHSGHATQQNRDSTAERPDSFRPEKLELLPRIRL